MKDEGNITFEQQVKNFSYYNDVECSDIVALKQNEPSGHDKYPFPP